MIVGGKSVPIPLSIVASLYIYRLLHLMVDPEAQAHWTACMTPLDRCELDQPNHTNPLDVLAQLYNDLKRYIQSARVELTDMYHGRSRHQNGSRHHKKTGFVAKNGGVCTKI